MPPEMPDPETLARVRAEYDTLPRSLRDVAYGKLKERGAIIEYLLAMSRAAAERYNADPSFVAKHGRLTGDPIIEHIATLIAGCGHVPEADRVVVPDAASGAVLVGLSPEERAHFAG